MKFVAVVEELLLAERVALERDLQDGHVRRAVADDERRRRARAASARTAVCEMAVTCAVAASIFAPGWKKILMTEMPVERLALDVLDVVDGRSSAPRS